MGKLLWIGAAAAAIVLAALGVAFYLKGQQSQKALAELRTQIENLGSGQPFNLDASKRFLLSSLKLDEKQARTDLAERQQVLQQLAEFARNPQSPTPPWPSNGDDLTELQKVFESWRKDAFFTHPGDWQDQSPTEMLALIRPLLDRRKRAFERFKPLFQGNKNWPPLEEAKPTLAELGNQALAALNNAGPVKGRASEWQTLLQELTAQPPAWLSAWSVLQAKPSISEAEWSKLHEQSGAASPAWFKKHLAERQPKTENKAVTVRIAPAPGADAKPKTAPENPNSPDLKHPIYVLWREDMESLKQRHLPIKLDQINLAELLVGERVQIEQEDWQSAEPKKTLSSNARSSSENVRSQKQEVRPNRRLYSQAKMDAEKACLIFEDDQLIQLPENTANARFVVRALDQGNILFQIWVNATNQPGHLIHFAPSPVIHLPQKVEGHIWKEILHLIEPADGRIKLTHATKNFRIRKNDEPRLFDFDRSDKHNYWIDSDAHSKNNPRNISFSLGKSKEEIIKGIRGRILFYEREIGDKEKKRINEEIIKPLREKLESEKESLKKEETENKNSAPLEQQYNASVPKKPPPGRYTLLTKINDSWRELCLLEFKENAPLHPPAPTKSSAP